MTFLVEVAREIIEKPSVFGKHFEKPKCKPWDIVKGRRFACCHGLGEHTRWCLSQEGTLHIPKFSSVSLEDLIYKIWGKDGN